MNETSIPVAELSPEEKRELLAGLLRKKVERTGIPLSFAQQRLWFLDQLEPGSTLYNISLTLRLRGPLNQDALDGTLSEVSRRHEVLRTRFEVVDGQPAQIISPPALVHVSLLDLSYLPAEQREIEVKRISRAEGRQPFDLSAGPLLRVRLLRVDREEHILLLTMHHIISDGWSMGVFIKEVSALYAAFAKGQPSPLADLPIQYADYAVWQRQHLRGEVLERQLAYWREQLSDAPRVLELPTDRPRPAVQGYHGAAESFTLSRQLTADLKALSREQNVTLFMTLLAAFQTLLFRYSGQTDVLVGAPIANRTRTETEGLIGFFINTLTLRSRFTPELTFIALLQQVKRLTLGAYAHQELPFEKLLDELDVERSLSQAPLFQVFFVLQNAPGEPVQLEGLELALLASENETAKFDLSLSMMETTAGLGGTIGGTISYRTELFDAETVRRLIENFERLLVGIAAAPDRRTVEFSMLSEADARLVAEVNDTWRPLASGQVAHELFELQVERSPEAAALDVAGNCMSYDELNRRANQLARYLRSLGVGPEVLVGILMERSVDVLVAVLAVLKAGGAYVPLDPEYPRERLMLMMVDADLKVLVTQQRLLGRVPEHKGPVVVVDEDYQSWEHESAENPVNRTTAENLAYLIFTSGSTGRPKGVMLSHRGLCNLAAGQREKQFLHIGPGERVLQGASLSFDLSVAEIFMSLLSGATLCLASNESLMLGPDLLELLRAQKITNITLMPTTLSVLPAADLPSLRCLVAAGEACSLDLVKRWAPGRRFINGFGPTEATCGITYSELTTDDHRVTIGRPIPNTQVYVLDQLFNIVPVGVRGELYLAGHGLARGYLKRPDLTAERFIPHPFSAEPGARLYRTGDLARFRAEGNLEYLGRVDDQVKVRGYRIELGEVGTVLTAHEAVKEAVVVLREDVPGEKRLVAYFVAVDGPRGPRGNRLTTGELRRHLEERLPAYMLPAAFVQLESLPLSANGKLNRKALPAPEHNLAEAEDSYTAPRTPTEEQLAAIWSKVLRLRRVGVQDNFFELGGDSILSIQIVARANQAGLRLTPKLLFQHQTIAALAAVISVSEVSAPAPPPETVSGAIPLTPIQQWFFDQHFANPHHFNQSLLLELSPAVNVSALQYAVAYLLEHHDALRCRFRRTESGWQQENLTTEPGQLFSLVDFSSLSDRELSPAIEAEAERIQRSLHLADGPLLRVVLFAAGPERPCRLLLVVHHLVIDGISWRILLEDLQRAYEQLSARQPQLSVGQPPQLSAKTTSYQQWAKRLRQYADSASLQAEAAYWNSEVQQFEPLPLDFAAGRNTYATAETVTASLSREETRALLQDVPSVYRTQISDVLLTALAWAGEQWRGQNKALAVALEGHGREQLADDGEELGEELDLTRTVGWFTTIYPVTLKVRAGSGVSETLREVKQQLRRIPGGGLGYGLLKYLSGAGPTKTLELAGLKAAPEPELSFNYLGQLDQFVEAESMYRAGSEHAGSTQDEQEERAFALEVTAMVAGERLQVSWRYSRELHRRETIERLAGSYIESLREIIRQCRQQKVGSYSPSDFPLARLNQKELDGIIAELTRRAAAEPLGNPPLIADIYPLSSLQHGLLFHTQYAPDAGVNFYQISCSLSHDLDLVAFERAWEHLIQRHAVLRTAFVFSRSLPPVQVVYRRIPLPLQQLDWRELTPADQRERLANLIEADRRTDFDFARAPLMRLTLIRLAADRYRFIWSFHHILLDGWSGPLLVKEAFACYDAYRRQQQPRLPRARPYRDYIAWLQSRDLSQAEQYWRATLAGFTTPTPLPGAPASAGDELYEERERLIDRNTSDALRLLGQRRQLTLNTITQGAWALLLSRYSGEREVLFGTPVSGRPAELSGVEEMIGLFINTLPVRVQVRNEEKVSAWLRELQREQAEMREYEYSPLVEVQRWSEVEAGRPLFECLFVFENYPLSDPEEQEESLQMSNVEVNEGQHYPLCMIVGPGAELSLRIIYDKVRFAAATIEQILEHFATLLKHIVANPEQRLAEISLHPEEPAVSRGELQLGDEAEEFNFSVMKGTSP